LGALKVNDIGRNAQNHLTMWVSDVRDRCNIFWVNDTASCQDDRVLVLFHLNLLMK